MADARGGLKALALPRAAHRAKAVEGRGSHENASRYRIGLSTVELYGQQIGGWLKNAGPFAKYMGGSSTNIACGKARLRSALGLNHLKAIEIEGFLRAIAGQISELFGFVSGLRIQALVKAIQRPSAEGKWIRVSTDRRHRLQLGRIR